MATFAGTVHRLRRPGSTIVLLAVVCGLVLWLLAPVFLRHDGSPVGADATVYVWWMRLAAQDGLATIGMRPGVPALSSILAAVTGASAETTIAALGIVLVVVLALAGGAFARSGGASGAVSSMAALLTGIFATYLAAGHLSNATFAALFLAGMAGTFAPDRRRGALCGVALIGAAGLAHPDFLVAAAAIMGVGASLAWIAHERREAITLIGVAAGGVGLTGLGVALALSGGPRFDVDTSRDVFLMRVGQVDLLRRLYLQRLAPKAAGYALWAWLPLTVLGLIRRRGALGRLLIAWLIVLVLGVVVGIVRQPFPPHRVIAFGFCLPILAAFGLEAIGSRLPRARLPVVIAVCAVLAASATITWLRAPRPFDAPTATAARQAGPALTATAPGTPVIVDLPTRGPGTVTAVLRAANVFRAEVGPGRIRDVLVRFPRPAAADAEALALWADAERRSADAAERATAAVEIRVGGVTPAVVPPVPNAATVEVSTNGPESPTSPADVASATIAGLLVLGFAGAGWAARPGPPGSRSSSALPSRVWAP